MKTLLHVGCGSSTIKNLPASFQNGGWEELRYDINPDVNPDIIGELQDMSIIEDGVIDAIYSSHNIEHVWAFEVPNVLAEFHRILGKRGFALILCPDMHSVAQAVVNGFLEKAVYVSEAGPITAMDIIYGYHVDIAKGNHFMAHKTAFTADTLANHVLMAKFSGVVVARDTMLGLHAVAFSSDWHKDDAEEVANALLPIESFTVSVNRYGSIWA